jgi:hypothetical protein
MKALNTFALLSRGVFELREHTQLDMGFEHPRT